MCAEISDKPNLVSLHVDRKSNTFKCFDSPVTKQKNWIVSRLFFFFLKFGVSHGDIWKSGLTISGSGACDGAEGSATAAQQSSSLRNHYCRCSYRKKKEKKHPGWKTWAITHNRCHWCVPSADLLWWKRGNDLCPTWGPVLQMFIGFYSQM